MLSYEALIERAKQIQILLMDCDGVLTDGRITLLPNGEEIKAFNAQDGHGLVLARQLGLRTGIITTRKSSALEHRAREINIEFLCQEAKDKNAAFEKLIKDHNLQESHAAFIGDDLPDLPVMKRVGLSIAVSNAVEELHTMADYITKVPGGNGAVRESIEFILKAQNKWKY